jgi:type I restriction enzyme S subunit
MQEKYKSMSNVPNLRFPGFDEEWEVKKLGEVFSIFNGYAFPSNESVESGILWVKIADVGLNEMKKDNLSFLPTYFKEKYLKFSLKKGDYVVALTRPILNGKLKIAQIDDYFEGALLNQRVGKIETINSKGFVYSYLQKDDLIKSIENNIAGSDPPNLSPNEINSIILTIPSFSEQEKIALFISLIDGRIQTQNKIIENLKTLIKGTSEKLFTQKFRFKDDNGNDFSDWEAKKLGKILTIGSGKDYKHLEKGDIPVFGTGGLMTYVNSFLYDGETVCIGRKGTIDKPMYYNGKIWTVDTLFYSHSFLNTVPKFVFYIFKMINWKEYNEASGVPSLSKNTIEKIKINIPSLPEQTKIASFLSKIDEKIEVEKQLLSQYENQKKYLLQNLFV